MKIYESPKVEFQKLTLNEKIADPCWGTHGKGKEYYYDYKGVGYVSFTVNKGSCDFNNITITHYGVPDSQKNAAEAELKQALIDSGGNDGTPYKGVGSTVFPDAGEDWS